MQKYLKLSIVDGGIGQKTNANDVVVLYHYDNEGHCLLDQLMISTQVARQAKEEIMDAVDDYLYFSNLGVIGYIHLTIKRICKKHNCVCFTRALRPRRKTMSRVTVASEGLKYTTKYLE